MKKLLALYFSGTGNTAYAVGQFCARLSAAGVECKIVSIENYSKDEKFDADTILVGYPIYGSSLPRILKEFLAANPEPFSGKNLITLATQYIFSGDGGALAARKIKCKHIASIHVNMPNNVTDIFAFLGGNSREEIDSIVGKADAKIKKCADDILNGKPINDGIGFFSWAAGFFLQRSYYFLIEKYLRTRIKISDALCNRCGECEKNCPMKDMKNCTQCYRCINSCPQKAIRLMSKNKPKIQYGGLK
jgi:flavodoxin/NAD-dependent dihydropyrimidine dehydrogenase PreA subunit